MVCSRSRRPPSVSSVIPSLGADERRPVSHFDFDFTKRAILARVRGVITERILPLQLVCDLQDGFVNKVAPASVRILQEESLAACRFGERAQHVHIDRISIPAAKDTGATVTASVSE